MLLVPFRNSKLFTESGVQEELVFVIVHCLLIGPQNTVGVEVLLNVTGKGTQPLLTLDVKEGTGMS